MTNADYYKPRIMNELDLSKVSAHYHLTLQAIVLSNQALYQRLKALHSIHQDAYFAAGIIRQLVWAVLHQQQYDINHMEIDVVFYDPDLKHTFEKNIQSALHRLFPDNNWDVVNQATVHHWYVTEQGEKISPYLSLIDALSTWPETATAIAVRLNNQNRLEIIAPFGLDDLFELKLCWNPKLVSKQLFLDRIQQKNWLQRWPRLKIINTAQ